MDIKWELTGTDRNDLKAIIGEDMLRVERLDKGQWWFAVYIEGSNLEYMSGLQFPHQSTKIAAKIMAEAIYKLIKN